MTFSSSDVAALANADSDASDALDSLTSALNAAAVLNPTEAQLQAVTDAAATHASAQEAFGAALADAGADPKSGNLLEAVAALRDAGEGQPKAALTKLPPPAEAGLSHQALRWKAEVLDTDAKRAAWRDAFTYTTAAS